MFVAEENSVQVPRARQSRCSQTRSGVPPRYLRIAHSAARARSRSMSFDMARLSPSRRQNSRTLIHGLRFREHGLRFREAIKSLEYGYLREAFPADAGPVPAVYQIRTYSWWRPPRIGLGRIRPTA